MLRGLRASTLLTSSSPRPARSALASPWNPTSTHTYIDTAILVAYKHSAAGYRTLHHPAPGAPAISNRSLQLRSTSTAAAAVTTTMNTTSATEKPVQSGPQEVPSGMEAEAALYESFCEVPVLNKIVARTVGAANNGQQSDLWLTASFTQRNLPANAQRKFSVQALLPAGGTQAVASLPVESADVLLSSANATGDRQLVIKAGADSISTIHQVWSGGRVTTELHVPKAQHGSLLTGGYFAADVAWHPQGQAVAYVAEVPADEKTPAWGGPDSIKGTAAPKSWRGVGTALEDWGELNTGKRAPGVYVLDITKKAVVKVSPSAPASISYGQPCWARDGSGLVLVGWPHDAPNFPEIGRRLGVVHCYNRPAQLWWVPITREPEGALVPGQAVPITSASDSSLSPVFSPDGSRLVYVSHNTAVRTGTHSATCQLCTLPWPQASAETVEPRVVVDVSLMPRPHTDAGFPGLYAVTLIDQPFPDNRTLLLTSQWRSANAILAVDLDTGSLAPITPILSGKAGPQADQYSYSLAAIQGGRLLGLRVAPASPPELITADIPSDLAGLSRSDTPPLTWQPVQGLAAQVPEVVATHLANLTCDVTQVTPWVGDTSQQFESVVIAPRNRQGPLPTIVAPHGGPHTAVTLGWYPMYAYLAALGYAIVCPNYRGSTGFGQAALQSLPGRVGSQDVEDCMAALDSAVKAGVSDPARVAVVGGSHGGFLTGHLLGQYPTAFKTGVMRNPVCNISLMVGITDITDWCFVEVWGCEEGLRRAAAVATPEDLERMYRQSPVAHVHKVKVPVTLMLGAKDRRVPLADGQQYASALRAAGVPVRTLVFPEDSHALDKPQTDFEQWITIAAALKQHLATSQ